MRRTMSSPPESDEGREVVLGQGRERRPERPEDRPVRDRPCRPAGWPAEHDERLRGPTSRPLASVRKRLAPMPPVPVDEHGRRDAAGGGLSTGAIRANADSRPTNVRAREPGGHGRILGAGRTARPRSIARKRRSVRRGRGPPR